MDNEIILLYDRIMNKSVVSQKVLKICDELPDFCAPFLLEAMREHTPGTRLAYAHELSVFFDYLTEHHPHFAGQEKRHIASEDLKYISTADINQYFTMSLEQLTPRTVARKRAGLLAFFTFMSGEGRRKIEENPVAGARKIRVESGDEVFYLTVQEQKKLLECVENGNGLDGRAGAFHERYRKRDAALIFLLLDTGIRVSELYKINIEDFDLEESSVIVMRSGGIIQTLYFSGECKKYLQEYLEEKQEKYPELSPKEPFFSTLQGKRLSIRAIEALVKKYAAASLGGAAGNISPHTLRSSFAMRRYIASGRDLLTLQKEMGHRSILSTSTYAKAIQKNLSGDKYSFF